MLKIIISAALLFSYNVVCWNTVHAQNNPGTVERRIDSILKLMSLEEKIGQMNQYNGPWAATGPLTNDDKLLDQVREGKVGSMLNVTGVKRTRELQQLALQSRLKIPLLFGQDVIHGYRTTFPLPLAEAASWDLQAIERSARIAAIESAAAGVHWTFAPMVDISRDPRWGRVMEGAGEDPYLGSVIAAARVKGFQGKGLGSTDAVMACAKHFAAYGAAVGGRDYNAVDMSLRMLHEVYLPPFKAAAQAGVATFMNAFNDLNGVPATGNRYLQRSILKDQWKFSGFVVSDWGSVGEMIAHGFVKDNYEAAMAAANAGSDMDMESRSHIQHLARLVKENKVSIAAVNDAVRRILRKKLELGLFDDPFRFCNEEREQQQWNNEMHLQATLDMARKSIVLLKNEPPVRGKPAILPLSGAVKTVAVIGPFVHAKNDHLGFWSYDWPDDSVRITSVWDGLHKKINGSLEPGKTTFLYAKGCNVNDADSTGFLEAVKVASQADIVIITIGEGRAMSGEAKSRSSIRLPGVQEELVKAVSAAGKPVVLLVSAGRPLIFSEAAKRSAAVLYTWWLGTKAGDAIADVLVGNYNPSAKLPMTFPRTEGQIPIYYSHFNTGRPAKNDSDLNYVSAYIDLPNSPAYPFGYGLSYSTFEYSDIQLNKKSLYKKDTLKVSVQVRNTGAYIGEEVVQLYIRDVTGAVVRPVKELKGFKKTEIAPGQSKQVSFYITTEDLKFYNDNLEYIWEPGEFEVMVGTDSEKVKKEIVTWMK
ncbi:MAG: beta-glucosidase BglX [Niabella sp.]